MEQKSYREFTQQQQLDQHVLLFVKRTRYQVINKLLYTAASLKMQRAHMRAHMRTHMHREAREKTGAKLKGQKPVTYLFLVLQLLTCRLLAMLAGFWYIHP